MPGAHISGKLWLKFNLEKIMANIAGTFSLLSRDLRVFLSFYALESPIDKK
jgi:hypothetical protein